jgi:hypothetical protein
MQPHNKGSADRAQLGASWPKGPVGLWVVPLGLQLHVLDLGPLLMRAASGGIALKKLHLTSWLFDSVIMC